MTSWRVRGTYLESCNCDAICPCRRIAGTPGGRSTHGICMGALSWLVEDGGGAAPTWPVSAPCSPSATTTTSPARRGITGSSSTSGQTPTSAARWRRCSSGALAADAGAAWAWKASRLLGVSAAAIEIDHTPKRGWFRVRNHVTVRVAGEVLGARRDGDPRPRSDPETNGS